MMMWAKNAPLSVFDDAEFYAAVQDYVRLPKDVKKYFESQGKQPSGNMKPDAMILREMFKPKKD